MKVEALKQEFNVTGISVPKSLFDAWESGSHIYGDGMVYLTEAKYPPVHITGSRIVASLECIEADIARLELAKTRLTHLLESA